MSCKKVCAHKFISIRHDGVSSINNGLKLAFIIFESAECKRSHAMTALAVKLVVFFDALVGKSS